jgi:hypothetical protein
MTQFSNRFSFVQPECHWPSLSWKTPLRMTQPLAAYWKSGAWRSLKVSIPSIRQSLQCSQPP